jgi:hypothetical protein
VKNDAQTIAQPRDIGHVLLFLFGVRSTGVSVSGRRYSLDRIFDFSIKNIVEMGDYGNYVAMWIEEFNSALISPLKFPIEYCLPRQTYSIC